MFFQQKQNYTGRSDTEMGLEKERSLGKKYESNEMVYF